jgi:hypothetical protein
MRVSGSPIFVILAFAALGLSQSTAANSGFGSFANSSQGQPTFGGQTMQGPNNFSRNGFGRDPMEKLYQHAVVISHDDGTTEQLRFAANHTFLWKGPRGERGHGTWEVAGGQICLSPLTSEKGEEMNAPGQARCAEFQAGHGAGDAWTQSNDRGERIVVRVE